MAPSTRNPTHGQKVDLGEKAPETTEGPGKIAKGSLAAESQAFKEANDMSSEQIADQREHFGTEKHAHSKTAYHGEGVGTTERLAQPEKKHEKHNNPPKHDTAITLKEDSHESSSGKKVKSQENSSNKDFSSTAKSGLGGGIDDKTYSEAMSGKKHSHAGKAPTYVNNVLGTEQDPNEGPHGKNIKMDKSISDQTGDPAEFDDEKDPGRLAEDKFAMAGNQGTVGESTGVRQKGIDGKTPFDALGSSEQA